MYLIVHSQIEPEPSQKSPEVERSPKRWPNQRAPWLTCENRFSHAIWRTSASQTQAVSTGMYVLAIASLFSLSFST